MKWSPILHGIAALTGIAGILALFAWWIAIIQGGTFLGVSQEHAYSNAIALFLASIAFGIGTLIHQRQEQQQ